MRQEVENFSRIKFVGLSDAKIKREVGNSSFEAERDRSRLEFRSTSVENATIPIVDCQPCDERCSVLVLNTLNKGEHPTMPRPCD
jgi:hypothetical protein